MTDNAELQIKPYATYNPHTYAECKTLGIFTCFFNVQNATDAGILFYCNRKHSLDSKD